MRTFTSFILIVLVIVISTIGFSSFETSTSQGSYPGFRNPEKINQNSLRLADIISQRERTGTFSEHNLLVYSTDRTADKKINESLNKYVLMALNNAGLRNLLNSGDENITVNIPLSRTNSIKLKLFRVDLYSDDFKISSLTKNSKTPQQVSKGIFYRGIINNDEKSLACISVYDEHISGFYADNTGNYEFGQLRTNKDQYILYKTSDDKNKNVFECGLGENDEKFVKGINKRLPDGNSAFQRPMKIYFQTDHPLWLQIGGNPQALSNYVTS
ncbi:MAG: hypothetical protein M3P82_00200, partial [Bacteroidota bacterium]|nr:hypothetical protein [Bacteroidota bacterium]